MKLSADIVVFDLDGTLCDIGHRLHHIKGEEQDWDAFNADCPNDRIIQPICELYRAMKAAGYTTVILTGRSELYRDKTALWLNDYGIDAANLFMRPANDYRSDYVVKMELAGKYVGFKNIVFAVEDRDRVVKAWRDNGVTCLQPCNGAY